MSWLDRYIDAVKRYLPAAERQDVGDELRSILDDKLEEAAATKQAPLEEDELLEILQDFGYPLQVAARYGQQRALVSETLLPLYKQVLKFLLLGFFSVWIGSIVLSVTGLVAWPEGVGDRIEIIGLWCIVLVTVAFYFSDSLLDRVDPLRRWNPRRLPAAYGPPIPLFDGVVGIVAALVVFSVLSAIENQYTWEILFGQAGEPWASFILWCKIRMVASMGLHTSTLFRPYWSRPKLVFSVAADALLVLIAVGTSLALSSEGAGVVGQIFLAGLAVIGLLGAGSSLGKLRRIGKPAAEQGPTWLERHVQRHVQRHLERGLPKSFGETVGRRVRTDLEKHRKSPD